MICQLIRKFLLSWKISHSFGFLSTLITLEVQGVDALRLMVLNVGNDNECFFDKHDNEHIKCKAQSSNILTFNFKFLFF
jgi:hypothetical protein